MTKQKNIICGAISFTAIILAYLLMGSGSFLSAENGATVKISREKNGREIAGSIIITSQPKAALKYAKTHGIKTNFKEQTTDKQKIIAFNELPSDPKIQKLEEDLDTEAMCFGVL